jgi:hypothetical protein
LRVFNKRGSRTLILPAFKMKKKCPNCQLVNFEDAAYCLRCRENLVEVIAPKPDAAPKSFFRSKLFIRAGSVLTAVLIALLGFYLTLLVSAKRLAYDEQKSVERSIQILDDKGFGRDVLLLRYLTAYRGTDNWLNVSTREENAYAATNFPFEIITLYPDFFMYPNDDTERAAILLHEAQHLKGADEKEAYEFVWKNRKQLGWTKETYGNSIVWRSVRRQTREIAPQLFVCETKEFADCTE